MPLAFWLSVAFLSLEWVVSILLSHATLLPQKKKKKSQPKTWVFFFFFFWCVHDCKGSGQNQSLEIKNSFVDKCDDGQFDLSYASEGNVKLITCRLERNRNRSCPSRKKWAVIQLCSVKELKGSDSTWEPESAMVEMEGCRFWCKFCSQTPSSIKMIKKKNQSENEQNGCVQRQLLPIYSVWTAYGLLTHRETSMLQEGWIWLLDNHTCKKKKKSFLRKRKCLTETSINRKACLLLTSLLGGGFPNSLTCHLHSSPCRPYLCPEHLGWHQRFSSKSWQEK